MQEIYVLGGGTSPERDVSLITSETICSNLKKAGYSAKVIDPADYTDWAELLFALKDAKPEMIFIGLHGAEGEDGRLQSILELSSLPYTGSGSHASSLAMDKNTALALALECGVTCAPHIALARNSLSSPSEIINITGLPLVIKPNSSGSSVGINIAQSTEEILPALESAWKYDRLALCEKYIPGRELTVTILDEKALPVVEIKPHNGWYDYANKYTHGKTQYICPAELTIEKTKELQESAVKIFKKLGCSVYARVDFRYDGKDFHFLEVNTLPGMTSLSLTPMAAKAAGIELPQLLSKIIEISKQKRG